MLDIFESILPIFLLVVLGVWLKRATFIDRGLWPGIEQLGYFVLFPALLFQTLYKADFGGLAVERIALAALLSIAVVSVLLLSLWPALRKAGISRGSFTTVFQTSCRWNAFIALAVGQKLAGAEGLALVALVMAVIVIPINFINVGMLVWFSHSERNWATLARKIVTNPLIIGCLAGLAMRLAPFPLYEPADAAIGLLARAALGLGLIMVGAGLRLEDALKPRGTVILPLALKLVVFPAIMLAACLLFGIRGETLYLMTLCAAVPTAMNGYVLARQMGGDAQLYAAVVTLQTAASFFTLPLVLWAAGLFPG